MGNWTYKLMEFMRGRRGMDQLGWFLFIVSLAFQIIGNLFRSGVLHYIGLALFFVYIFRILSKNIYKREAENRKYIEIKNRVSNWFYFRKQKQNQTRNEPIHTSYYCPSCKQLLRVPVGQGHIKVTCPKCGEKFDMNT